MSMEPKPVSNSRTILTQLVFPSDTNMHGTMFGGIVMEYIDKVGAIASMRHARKPAVTASSDSLDFLAPIRVGEAIEIEAFVTSTRRSSMEVYVKVYAENLLTGERKITVTSFLTFVALGEDGKPTEVPAIIPETEEEKHLFATAQERYDQRKKRRHKEVVTEKTSDDKI